MVFSSLLFLFFFLPLVLIIYYISPKNIRLAILFIASLIFYAWGEPVYIILIIFSTLVDYCIGFLIYKFSNSKFKKIFLLIVSVTINLSLLGFFKYSNFLINIINYIFKNNFNMLDISLPIGISFYTFQTLSYTIDIFRNKFKPQKNIIAFGAYVSLFPQLIAGPIVTYESVENDINNKNRENILKFNEGVCRFIEGLSKKIILANNLGYLFETLKSSDLTTMSTMTSWLCILSYFFQIYFDFSGYSDMAIGLGKMFGFNFNENFNYPYISRSISEFWRRWHISLGSWFKNYLYIPLGGNKVKFKYLNLLIVWIFTGLWHGANLNFLLWGLYFFIIIMIEKLFLIKYLNKYNILSRIYTLFLILIGWCIFVFEDINYLILFLKKMFSVNLFIDNYFLYYFKNFLLYILIACLFSTPIMKNLKLKLPQFISNTFLILIFIISISFIVNSSFNPFLYFRF